MTTETTETTPTTTTTPSAKEPQTNTITLTGPNATSLQLVAERTKDGARTYVISIADKKSSRGMSEKHVSFEAAKAAIAVMATKAEKLGWVRRAARRGFVAKPDAFTALPPAPKAAKK